MDNFFKLLSVQANEDSNMRQEISKGMLDCATAIQQKEYINFEAGAIDLIHSKIN